MYSLLITKNHSWFVCLGCCGRDQDFTKSVYNNITKLIHLQYSIDIYKLASNVHGQSASVIDNIEPINLSAIFYVYGISV